MRNDQQEKCGFWPVGKLLGQFTSGWHILMHRLPPLAEMVHSQLQPFVVVIERVDRDEGSRLPHIELTFSSSSTAVNADQLAKVLKVGQ